MPAQAVADHGVVVDDDDADGGHDRPTIPGATIAGTRAETAVPAPGSDSIASVPATRFTRCRMADNPKPGPALLRSWQAP